MRDEDRFITYTIWLPIVTLANKMVAGTTYYFKSGFQMDVRQIKRKAGLVPLIYGVI